MGVAVSRHYMCCSLRDKQGFGDGIMDGRSPHFQCLEAAIQLDCPVMVAFAPLHQREASCLRRLAVANTHEVNVYRMPEGDVADHGAPPQLMLTHTLKLDPGTVVNGILFSDEDSSRQLLVSMGPEGGKHGPRYPVKVYSCEQIPAWLPQVLHPVPEQTPATADASSASATAMVVDWKEHEVIAILEEHKAPVMRLATNKTYLLTADAVGECRLWQRNRGFARRALATLHTGGVSDLIMDRLWAYSAGCEDRRICVWTLPELSPVLSIAVDLPDELVMGTRPCQSALPRMEAEAGTEQAVVTEATGSAAPDAPRCHLSRINLLQRPLSRWAGWQGSTRGTKAPRGSLFVAGVLGEGSEIAGAGAGVLMQWTLGETAMCQNAQIAHDTPIVTLVYGPYDNGPLITADSKGIFRVWELLLERGLCLSQQLEVPGVRVDLAANGIHCPAVAVEQPQGLYIAAGAPRLLVWQRHQAESAGGLSRM